MQRELRLHLHASLCHCRSHSSFQPASTVPRLLGVRLRAPKPYPFPRIPSPPLARKKHTHATNAKSSEPQIRTAEVVRTRQQRVAISRGRCGGGASRQYASKRNRARCQELGDTEKQPQRARSERATSDTGHVGTSGRAVRATQQRGRAHLRHVQRRLRGRLPLRQRCHGGGVLQRRHCHWRGAASPAAHGGDGGGAGGRGRYVVGAQEEAAAAGAELQVQGGGGEPADHAHRRGAQPPAPDERVPRRAPLPHAGGLRPKGRPSFHCWGGDRVRQGARAAAAVPRGAETNTGSSSSPAQGETGCDANANASHQQLRQRRRSSHPYRLRGLRDDDEQLQQQRHRGPAGVRARAPVRGLLHVPAVRVVPPPAARLHGGDHHAPGGGRRRPAGLGGHRGEPGGVARQRPRHGAAPAGAAAQDDHWDAGAAPHRAAPHRHHAGLHRALLPEREAGGRLRPNDGGRHRRGGAPRALHHRRRRCHAAAAWRGGRRALGDEERRGEERCGVHLRWLVPRATGGDHVRGGLVFELRHWASWSSGAERARIAAAGFAVHLTFCWVKWNVRLGVIV